jgi:ribosomal protein S18 acetylase RimI-like enzyme
MSQPIVLRRYEPRDFEQANALHVRALVAVGAYLGEGLWDDDLRRIEEIYLRDRGEFLVGDDPLDPTRIVAMGALRKTTATRAEVKRMRVHADYQGRGYGRQILAALEARANELGYTTLHLDTSTVQAAARRLYEGAGYREVRRGVIRGLEIIYYEKHLR